MNVTASRCKDALERAGFSCERHDATVWVLKRGDREVILPKLIRDLSDLEFRQILVTSGLQGNQMTKLLNEPNWRINEV
jgi:hypothetical protein